MAISKLKLKGKSIYENTAIAKFNEVIDAINKHEDILRQIGEWGSSKGECLWCEKITEFDYKQKWIGKLCKFWVTDIEDCIYGILTTLDDTSPLLKYKKDNVEWFTHCEPINLDDDIIYKKEQQ